MSAPSPFFVVPGSPYFQYSSTIAEKSRLFKAITHRRDGRERRGIGVDSFLVPSSYVGHRKVKYLVNEPDSGVLLTTCGDFRNQPVLRPDDR